MDLSTAGGSKVWAGSGSRLLVLIVPQPSRRPDKTGARFGFASGRWSCPDQSGVSLSLGVARGLSFLQMVPGLDASNLEQIGLSTAGGSKVWAGSGWEVLGVLEKKPWQGGL